MQATAEGTERYAGLTTNTRRTIQFRRSTPVISVGMGQRERLYRR